MRSIRTLQIVVIIALAVGLARAALIVPTDIEQPGTQPGQAGNLESPDRCDNCHGGYDTAVEPAHNWRGSMMANATRDPLFWATMAVAEQDFDGSGDLCLRCHTTGGWLGGRSTPTDGSALTSKDADGVDCDFCHKSTNPDNSEHVGAQTSPYIANDRGNPAQGYYGSGMYSIWGGNQKLGPYADVNASHQFMQSKFHRSVDFCGVCHDVSNPAVGDLAHNNGAQIPLAAGQFSGVPGSPVAGKAAFKNFPFQYGVVERTFSEHKSSALSRMLVSDYHTLPVELRGGALKKAYEDSIVAGTGGNYEDGTPRYFSCQTCHMAPVTGQGCNKKPPVRKDLPLHDMTGGNYWVPDAIKYLNTQGKLRLGGGLNAGQIAALDAGKQRALAQLRMAASLSVTGNSVRVVNQTGHKIISGYPEGRRMWLNIKWYGADGSVIREDGRYGPMPVLLNGQPAQVNTILNPYDPNTKVYEAHYAMTREWAVQLRSLGYPADMPLSFDRVTGDVSYTLGDLAAQSPNTYHETFHFVLNNQVVKDNRIPPYRMSYDEASRRNSLPVPANQYGNPGPGEFYRHWDEVTLNPPAGAIYATINLLYQPTSWEYVQFLYLANRRQNAFLANEGAYLLEAWLATGMAAPEVMATAVWGAPIGILRSLTDGSTVQLSGRVVTAAFGGASYIEEDDRSSGIRIQHSGSLSWADRIALSGQIITTADGERAISADWVSVVSQGNTVPRPLGMTNRHLGGSGTGLFGLDNTGLLVTTTGRVTHRGADFFYIDDGTGRLDGSGYRGVRVLAAGLTIPALDKQVKVTGISAAFRVGGVVQPVVRVRTQSDITTLN